MKTLVYDGFDFDANGLVLTEINTGQPPERNLQLENLAERDGAAEVQSRLRVKRLVVQGYFIGSDIDDAEAMADTLNTVCNRSQRRLVTTYAGERRVFQASPDNWSITQPRGLNRITFTIEFSVNRGYGESENFETLFSETITNPVSTVGLTAKGSARVFPEITMTLNTATGGTGNMNIRNGADQIGIGISRTWSADDQVILDCARGQLFINGTLTKPEGKIPSWNPGNGTLYYSDTFTAREVEISAVYRPRYL